MKISFINNLLINIAKTRFFVFYLYRKAQFLIQQLVSNHQLQYRTNHHID